MRLCSIFIRFLFLALLAGVLPSQAKWLKLTSPNFELFTDAGERTGRRALVNFEQIHQVFLNISAEKKSSLMPVRVYLFASSADYDQYTASKEVTGFALQGAERDYIVMQTLRGDVRRTAFHEYVHLVLHRSYVQPSRMV